MALADQCGTFDLGDGLEVTRLGFGAMRLCGPDIIGPPADEAEAKDVLKEAVSLGIDLIDTADSYGPGVSERLIGETLGDNPSVTVASKAGLLRSSDGEWLPHGDPDYLHNQALCSLDRLRTDSIDLYQFHRPDPDTAFEDSVIAFADLLDEGLIDRVGLSNVSVEQLETARDHVDIATVQNRYNITDREEEPVLEACADAGIGFIPWYPIAAGDLGEVGDALDTVATKHDATRAQIALAWLLDRDDVVLPIPGTSSLAHLRENVDAAGLSLDGEDRARLPS